MQRDEVLFAFASGNGRLKSDTLTHTHHGASDSGEHSGPVTRNITAEESKNRKKSTR